MSSEANITVPVTPETRAKLARLATDMRRSEALLAADAISAYVDRALDIIEGIDRGLSDAAAGRVVPHEEAMAELYGVIEAAEAGRT